MPTKNRMNDAINRIHPGAWYAVCLTVSILLFALVLLNRSPNLLRPLSMSLRTGFGLIIPATALTVYLVFRIPGRIGELAGMAVVLTLFAMPLAGLWASGGTQTTVLSGLIPLYDAGSYYADALALINGREFSSFSARRPLFPGLLAVLLLITDHNLMASLAILTGIVGLACYLMAREIQRTHGAEIAVFVLILVFLFYRLHSGISMTENLGVALGVIGFGLLWRGAADLRFLFIWFGILVTCLALNARAGAFFMLPLLILWAGWLFRQDKPINIKVILLGTLAVALGFLCNLVLTRLIAVPGGVPFANFSYTLYGLASGGKSWAYVFEVHPELLSMQEPEHSQRVYQLAFELIRENPWQVLKGAMFNWQMLFSDSWYNIYSYVEGENWRINVLARWSLYLLALLGIGAWLQDRKDPVKSLVMIMIAGIFLSVPFLPPTDAYRMRPYAANIVIMAALPALGFKFALERNRLDRFISNQHGQIASLPLLAYSMILIGLLMIGPLVVKSIARPVSATIQTCSSAPDMVVARFDRGTYINIKKENIPFIDWMPDFHIGLFRRNSHSLPDAKLLTWASTIEPGNTILLAMDYRLQQELIVIVPTNILPEDESLLQLCGRYEHGYDTRMFYAEEAITLPQ